MADATINGCVNFDIVEAVAANQPRALTKIVDTFKELVNGNKNFDPTTQNLTIAQFLVNKNPSAYLNKLEKKGVQLEELLRPVLNGDEKALVLSSLYIVYNCIFFRKLNRKYTSFGDETLANFKIDLDRNGPVPNFPLMKILLSKLNFLFNYSLKAFYFVHQEDINKLKELSKTISEKRASPPFDNSVYVSPTYACLAYHLPHIEQNNYNDIELLILYLLHSIIIELFQKNSAKVTQGLVELKDALARLKQVPTAEYKDLTLRDSENCIKVKLSQQNVLSFEKNLHRKLCDHLSACVAFLELLHHVHSTPFISDSNIFYNPLLMKNGQFKSKYNLALQNLIAIASFKNRNFCMANLILRKAIASSKLLAAPSKKDDEVKSLLELAKSSNQILQTPLYYNLAISYMSIGNYEQAVSILNSIVIHFKLSYQFWYRLGVCYHKLFLKELGSLAKASREAFQSAMHDDVSKHTFSKTDIQALNLDNALAKYNERVARETKELNNHLDSFPYNKNSNLHNAIFAFNNCALIVRKKYCIDAYTPSNSREKGLVSISEYLVSSLNFLAFLYSASGQHVQALNVCVQALGMSGLPPARRAHFIQIKLRSLIKLKKNGMFVQEMAAFEQKEKPSEANVQFYYPVGGKSQLCQTSAPIMARIYKLIFAIQNNDQQTARTLLDTLMADLTKRDLLRRGGELELLMRHLMLHFNHRLKFSRENLEKLLNPLTDLSKISFK